MLPTLLHTPDHPADTALAELEHVLVLLPAGETLPLDCPDRTLLEATLSRRQCTVSDLDDEAVTANSAQGRLRTWASLDLSQSTYTNHTRLRGAIAPLLDETPARLDIIVCFTGNDAERVSELATYVSLANGTPLPNRKQKEPTRLLTTVQLWGCPHAPAPAQILADANRLARTLVARPANALTPMQYRERIAELAAESGWDHEAFDLPRLRALGAGAFISVAQGSETADAAIVRVSWIPDGETPRVALVGKGICFDTGGHNLKSADSMIGMHEDMAGSAAVLGLLLAATRLRLPVRIDAWLAIASNDISPRASRQGDVVTALDGTTIEIVHTDAEGRMVLADTLALAVRDTPALTIDFGTLTYTMIHAVGTRYAGIFASNDDLAALAVQAGRVSGERVTAFPLAEDYEDDLDSTQADICQCSLDEDAPDHIHAALFLKRFVGDRPWLHVDLSSASCEDGLGAIGTDQTGFGVAWGLQLLHAWLDRPDLRAATPAPAD